MRDPSKTGVRIADPPQWGSNVASGRAANRRSVMNKESAWGVALAVAFAFGGCHRTQVDEDLKQTGKDVAATVRDSVESAKDGAERVKTQLPAATERAKAEVVAVGEEVRTTLKNAGDKIKEGASEARDAVKPDEKH
jgi:gas vesicle protein